VCAESPTALQAAASARCDVITYGTTTADYTPRNIAYLPSGIEFDVSAYGHILGRVAFPLFGKHNVLNALAATAAVLKEGLSLNDVIRASQTFKGAYRRFQILTPPDAKVVVIDDYAHHPTEVAATLTAAKLHFGDRRLIAVFRPHTYSRTAALLNGYRTAFSAADVVYVTDIEGAREAEVPAGRVNGQDVATQVGPKARYVTDRAQLAQDLVMSTRSGDIVVCMTVSGYQDLAGNLARSFAAST
jgi:UDP-N-acetylmuramate--alanine ligase